MVRNFDLAVDFRNVGLKDEFFDQREDEVHEDAAGPRCPKSEVFQDGSDEMVTVLETEVDRRKGVRETPVPWAFAHCYQRVSGIGLADERQVEMAVDFRPKDLAFHENQVSYPYVDGLFAAKEDRILDDVGVVQDL